MIKVLLWDIDGTVLNFEKAEACSMQDAFNKYHLGIFSDEYRAKYTRINNAYWKKLERNEISKQEVLLNRFRDFFAEVGIAFDDYAAFNLDFQLGLGDHVFFNDDAFTLISDFKGHFLQCAVTNGTFTAQNKKLATSHLYDLLDDVFISDVLKVEKPNRAFFEQVLSTIGSYDKDEILIIGDSLTSDIQGGNNIGIKTCLYDPNGNINTDGYQVDYHIQNLNELRQILKID